MSSTNDVIDLREVGAALRREYRWVIAGVLLGLAVATGLLVVLPVRYEGTATVLVQDAAQVGGSAFSPGGGSRGGGLSFGGLADLFSRESGFDTELEVLTSRAVLGAVVDSIGLQARVLKPSGLSQEAIFASVSYDPYLPKGKYRFQREGERYRVTGRDGFSVTASPGVPVSLPGAVVTLRAEQLPNSFAVELRDRQDVVDELRKRVVAEQAGGNVAEVVYRAADPLTAAAVPNALVEQYLKRRQTTDRSSNQHRYEFLDQQVDSLSGALVAAEHALRRYQETSGVIDPDVQSRSEIERAMALRSQLEALEVETRALDQVVAQSSTGTLSAREIAAYPSLLHNPAINHLLGRLSDLEARRTELLDRRTEQDPDVASLDRSIQQLENQLVAHSRAYRDGVARQQAEVAREFGRYRATLSMLPAQVEESFRLQREVERLSETLVALQTQLVQARLAAITEGGEVRQLDVAQAPKQVTFPRKSIFLPIGLVGGLMLGVVGAIGSAYLRQTIRYPHEVELATGTPCLFFRPDEPILLGGFSERGTLLVIPVGRDSASSQVARRIATTASLQGHSVVLAELENSSLVQLPSASTSTPAESSVAPVDLLASSLRPSDQEGGAYVVYHGSQNGASRIGPRAALQELESRFGLVVAAVPHPGHTATTALLSTGRIVILVATAGRVTRTELQEQVTSLDRIGVRTASVVLQAVGTGGSLN